MNLLFRERGIVPYEYGSKAADQNPRCASVRNWGVRYIVKASVSGLLAELAEIDENFVRVNLSPIEFGDLLLRRKEIYEELHPETKAGVSQALGMNTVVGNDVECNLHSTSKSFVDDTAEKLGVNPSTIKRQIQTAKNLTPEAKTIIKNSDTDISKTNALKLSRLEPKQQEQAATQLVAGTIKSVDEYQKPYSIGGKQFSSF